MNDACGARHHCDRTFDDNDDDDDGDHKQYFGSTLIQYFITIHANMYHRNQHQVFVIAPLTQSRGASLLTCETVPGRAHQHPTCLPKIS